VSHGLSLCLSNNWGTDSGNTINDSDGLCLTLREQHRLRMFENRALRRISGSKRDEVMGDQRKLRNEELHNLYSLSSIIRIFKSRKIR
jgi:hypothetical protein